MPAVARWAPLLPTWTPDPRWYQQYPETDVPILMLNGALDGRTSVAGAEQVASALDGPNQQLVVLPYVGHAAIRNSFYPNGSVSCGMELALAFFTDPTATLDTSCTESITPTDFTSTGDAAGWLGVDDIWDNP